MSASNEYRLARVAAYLHTALPGLAPRDLAEIAVEATMTGGALIDKDGGLQFDDAARTVIERARREVINKTLPSGAASRAVARERHVHHYRAAERLLQEQEPTDLGSVTGSDDTSKAQRAAIRERTARERLGLHDDE